MTLNRAQHREMAEYYLDEAKRGWRSGADRTALATAAVAHAVLALTAPEETTT